MSVGQGGCRPLGCGSAGPPRRPALVVGHARPRRGGPAGDSPSETAIAAAAAGGRGRFDSAQLSEQDLEEHEVREGVAAFRRRSCRIGPAPAALFGGIARQCKRWGAAAQRSRPHAGAPRARRAAGTGTDSEGLEVPSGDGRGRGGEEGRGADGRGPCSLKDLFEYGRIVVGGQVLPRLVSLPPCLRSCLGISGLECRGTRGARVTTGNWIRQAIWPESAA